jgi:hypothetical protein
MKTFYRAIYPSAHIDAVSVVRETDCFIWIAPRPGRHGSPRREKRQTEWGSYHETWEAARCALLDFYARRAESHTKVARTAEATIASIRALTPPESSK